MFRIIDTDIKELEEYIGKPWDEETQVEISQHHPGWWLEYEGGAGVIEEGEEVGVVRVYLDKHNDGKWHDDFEEVGELRIL